MAMQRMAWKNTVHQGRSIDSSCHLSRLTTKPIKWPVRPVKTQINLGIRTVWSASEDSNQPGHPRPVWSESSLSAQWIAKDPRFLHADSEDFVQTGRMPRLIWDFVRRTDHFVGFVMRQLLLRSMYWSVLQWNTTLLLFPNFHRKNYNRSQMGVVTMDTVYE